MDILTHDTIDSWLSDLRGPTALHYKQILVPVEGEGAVIFPPTYAAGEKKSPYSQSTINRGATTVVQIDSVGSQANRMEPIFRKDDDGRENTFASLVPQIGIEAGGKVHSLLDAGHRLADAFVRSSTFAKKADLIFTDILTNGDAESCAKFAPTTLLFGAWDSRGNNAKVPRIISSEIRGWDIDVLTRSAQYVPAADYAKLGLLNDKQKEETESDAQGKNKYAVRGFAHQPAVDKPGGVVVRDRIERNVTINLVALRNLGSTKNGAALRQYILGLALVAATAPQDGFLRQGCLLVPRDNATHWALVERTGVRITIGLNEKVALSYARASAEAFGVGPDEVGDFDLDLAKDDLVKKDSKKKPGDAESGDDSSESETSEIKSRLDRSSSKTSGSKVA